MPDTPENAERFGYATSMRGESAYPIARLCALMALRSHLLAAVSFGAYAMSELRYAEPLWREVPNDSLVIIDRGFFSARLFVGIRTSGENRHWLTRLKANSSVRVLKMLGDGDALVELTVSSEARRQDPSLPQSFLARRIDYQKEGFEPQQLLTSLTDADVYPRDELVALYHERWELELGYREIKTTLLKNRESIRSKTPDGVEQEIWGLLLAYNLVRVQMERVAAQARVAPTRISFVNTLRLVEQVWLWNALSMHDISPTALARSMKILAERMRRCILPERRPRPSAPRAVKIKMSNYPRKRRPAKH